MCFFDIDFSILIFVADADVMDGVRFLDCATTESANIQLKAQKKISAGSDGDDDDSSDSSDGGSDNGKNKNLQEDESCSRN